MSFVGSMFSNDQGSGFQAQGMNTNQNSINSALGDLNNVNGQLSTEAQGGGPVNQATQAQLTNATNQGIKQAAGTVASAKGLNPALAARLAGQQASGSLQNAANASAGLTAQNAMNAQTQLSNNLVNQYGTAQGGINAANASNASIAQGNQSAQQGLVGGGISALGSALNPTSMFAKGGMVENYAFGSPDSVQPGDSAFNQYLTSGAAMGEAMGASPMDINATMNTPNPTSAPSMMKPQLTQPSNQSTQVAPVANSNNPIYNGMQSFAPKSPMQSSDGKGGGLLGLAALLNKGGEVQAMLSPGEKYLPPQKAKAVAQGKADPIKSGKTVPGQAKVKGDSLKNDTVPAVLQEGGVVIPRSVLDSKDPQREASKFVAAALMHHKLAKKYPR